ncbi:MAG TPA: sulfatase-like hydrolase/transferase [Bryobacteraceae bacterium]|nr:sulfatase-like hydrolase/transferase [Bryobacteraceae bacterium]
MMAVSAMSIHRRNFLLGGLALPALARKERIGPRPNIVLIVADGLGAWMLGSGGNKEIRTPNLDQLAQAGTRFPNHLACTPSSSPSLATLLTGRVPRQHGIQDFLTGEPIENPPQGQAAAPPSFRNEILLSDILAGVGYECGFVGEWNLGDDRTPQHGFHFWYTIDGAGVYQDPHMNWNGQSVAEKGYLTDLITAKAGTFFEQQTVAKPFFLTIRYLNPHPPYDGHPARYQEMYAKTQFDTTGWEPAAANALRGKEYFKDPVGTLRKAAAGITALDDQIPLLLAKLSQRGLRENTIVVVTSSNGHLLGRHGLWTGGLASNPINMYDEVVLTPMIWHWLGRVPAQSLRPEVVSAYDLVPTVCGLLEVPPPEGRNLCGRSYHLLVMGKPLPKKSPWRAVVFGNYRNTEMARDTRFKLVLRNNGSGPNEFFDLADDPREKANLYENPKFLVERDQMRRAIESWRASTSA